jgi:hypothetical protein
MIPDRLRYLLPIKITGIAKSLRSRYREFPLRKLRGAEQLTISRWTLNPRPLRKREWWALSWTPGRYTWLGYDKGGIEQAGDERALCRIKGQLHGVPCEVWFYHSKLRGEVDVIPFTDTTIHGDDQGDHLGQHPYGAWTVPERDILRLKLLGENYE